VVAQQCLHDRDRDEFGVDDLRADTDPGSVPVQLWGRLHFVVDPAVQCGREGVQIDVHVASMVSLHGNVDHGDPRLLPLPQHPLE
jgi:hypothetical protein